MIHVSMVLSLFHCSVLFLLTEEKKEEKKPEPESESDDDMGFGLFD